MGGLIWLGELNLIVHQLILILKFIKLFFGFNVDIGIDHLVDGDVGIGIVMNI